MSSRFELPLPNLIPFPPQLASPMRNDGLRVVAFGGGTGLSTLLRGLKPHVRSGAISRLTAVVAVTDDGGSSGRLRNELHMLPPGDIRNCLVALADDEALLARLFDFRFEAGDGLIGHSLGNLLLAALERMSGNFVDAVQLAGRMLSVCGEVLPATASDCQLYAVLKDGSCVVGETAIARQQVGVHRLGLLAGDCDPLPQTLQAIAEADLITFGPGSLFTSLTPHLLVNGVARAIAESPALRVFVCNIMTEPYETTGFSATDHVRALQAHASEPIFDAIAVNREVPAELRDLYATQESSPVKCDLHELRAMGLEVIEGDFVGNGPLARHAPERLASTLVELAAKRQATTAACVNA